MTRGGGPKRGVSAAPGDGAAPSSLRLDKWLWHARMCKTRSLAQQLVQDGAVRIDSVRTVKPAHAVHPGHVLTLAVGGRVRVLRVVALGTRRGPAEEAQQLYDDLSEPAPPASERAADPQVHGGGRPEGRERRRFDALRRSMDD